MDHKLLKGREEVLGLRWSCVDFDAKEFRVNHTVTKGMTVNRVNSTKTATSARTYPLTEEQVKAEANRCLKCGATTVDVNRCIGCGLCTTRCEFDAIRLERDMPQNTRMLTAEESKLKAIIPYALKRELKIKLKK